MKNFYLFIMISLLFSGCMINGVPNMKDYADGWIGTDINEKYKTYKLDSGSKYVQRWRNNKINKDYYLENGNFIHVYPARKGCLIHWEVDKNTNKIIGYTFEGDRCY